MTARKFVGNSIHLNNDNNNFRDPSSKTRAPSRKRSAPKNPLPVISKLTHLGLLNEYCSQSNQEQFKRVRKAVLQWWDVSDITPDSVVKNEYTERFESSLKCFIDKLSKEGASNGTLYNKTSSIRSFEKFVRGKMDDHRLPDNFTERLRYLLAERGLVPNQLREEVSETAYHWALFGKTPQTRSLPVVKKLESFLEVEPGTLSGLMVKAKTPVMVLKADTKYRLAKAQQSRVFQFRLNELPPQLEAEFQKLIAHKRQVIFRVTDPTTRRVTSYSTKLSERWNSSKTIDIYRQHLARFFGYLCLPVAGQPWDVLPDDEKLKYGKHGKALSELQLIDLVNHEYLSDFISYCLVRGNGTFSQNEMHFGIFTNMLVNKSHSFFCTNYPKYGPLLKLNQLEYAEWCKARHQETLDICAAIRPLVELNKADKEKVVNDLLRSDNPLKIFREVSDRVLATSKPKGTAPIQAAKAFRDHLLLELLIYRPLRIGEVSLLRLGSTMVQDSAGLWTINIPRLLLKNSIHPYANDIDLPLGDRISKKVDEYLKEHRPAILKGRETDAVFVIQERGEATSDCEPSQLSRMFAAMMKTFFTVSFGPHVLRHVWTTHYLNKNPGDFKGAAALLNDSEEVVRQTYDKSSAADAMKRVNAFREVTMGEAE